jgi:hypothetical protein
MSDVVAQKMFNEPADRSTPTIACGRGVVASSLNVVEERKHCIDSDVFDPKVSDRPTDSVGEEDEEQP